MADLSLGEINDRVLEATGAPTPAYYLVLLLLAGGIGWGFLALTWQTHVGMGASGLNHPVGWGVYIANFVFWVGIAHSGTLISAILFLVRAKWRDTVSRASEAMTVFAVMTAGLFPLIHLGRLWTFYYILPYPSQRQIWPNFLSPLLWDVLAVATYFIVSTVFFFLGMIPDAAAARDRAEEKYGVRHWRARLYRTLALGWSGTANQWRHYGRSYLFFAALATPLVISVHSIVSWDFAISLLPGWHTTIFAPYFVAGAIHSGLAMVLTLMIPMRRLLRLNRIIQVHHFEMVAQTMLVTTLIVAYSYAIEPFIAWYSGNVFEQQFAAHRALTWGSPMTWIYWSMIFFNVLVPLAFIFRRVRRNIYALFGISILVNIGMWLERFHIVVESTARDFLPHNWGSYLPSWVEVSITAGSFAFFLFWFLSFSKLLPAVPMADIKEQLSEENIPDEAPCRHPARGVAREEDQATLLAVFKDPGELLHALKALCDAGFERIDTFSPIKLRKIQWVLGRPRSPVRFWTLAGALAGLVGGFALAIGTAQVNGLIVGGKPPVSLIPFCIVGFEGMILFGSLGNLFGFIAHSRLYSRKLAFGYDRRFSRDRYGLVVACVKEERERARNTLKATAAEEIHDVRA